LNPKKTEDQGVLKHKTGGGQLKLGQKKKRPSKGWTSEPSGFAREQYRKKKLRSQTNGGAGKSGVKRGGCSESTARHGPGGVRRPSRNVRMQPVLSRWKTLKHENAKEKLGGQRPGQPECRDGTKLKHEGQNPVQEPQAGVPEKENGCPDLAEQIVKGQGEFGQRSTPPKTYKK